MSAISSDSADEFIRPAAPWVQTLLSEAAKLSDVAKQRAAELEVAGSSFTIDGASLKFWLTFGQPPNPTKDDLQVLNDWESGIKPLSHEKTDDYVSRRDLTAIFKDTITKISNHWNSYSNQPLPSVQLRDWQVDTHCESAPPDRYYAVRVTYLPAQSLATSMPSSTAQPEVDDRQEIAFRPEMQYRPQPEDRTAKLLSMIGSAARMVNPTFSVCAHSFSCFDIGIGMQISLYERRLTLDHDPTLDTLNQWVRSVVALSYDRGRDKQSRQRLQTAITASLRDMKSHHAYGSTAVMRPHICGDWEVQSTYQDVPSVGFSGEAQTHRSYYLYVKPNNYSYSRT